MDIEVTGDFPGGNIQVLGIDGSLVELDRALHAQDSDWFWWSFRVRCGEGRKLSFRFPNRDLVGELGPAVSLDRRNWEWAGRESFESRRGFSYSIPASADEIHFAFSFPYVLEDLERFLNEHAFSGKVKREALAVSRHGREVPLLLFGDLLSSRDVLLTCRHHCCESVASFVLEGAMAQILEEERELCGKFRFACAPFVDLDGAEEGDQGKSRRPHDHGRDYTGAPIYPETKAIMEMVSARMDAMRVIVDFHCPWAWGGQNDAIFFSEGPMAFHGELCKFKELLREEARHCELPYDGSLDVREGELWNKSLGNLLKGHFLGKCPNLLFSTCLETSYCFAQGQIVTPARARSFGRSFAKALSKFLLATI